MCNYCCPVGIANIALTELMHCDLDCNINGLNVYLGCVSTWIDEDGNLRSAYETDYETDNDYVLEDINFCPKCGEDLRVIKKLRDSGVDLEFCFQDDLNGKNVCDVKEFKLEE